MHFMFSNCMAVKSIVHAYCTRVAQNIGRAMANYLPTLGEITHTHKKYLHKWRKTWNEFKHRQFNCVHSFNFDAYNVVVSIPFWWSSFCVHSRPLILSVGVRSENCKLNSLHFTNIHMENTNKILIKLTLQLNINLHFNQVLT